MKKHKISHLINRLNRREIEKVVKGFGKADMAIEDAIYGGHKVKGLDFSSCDNAYIPDWLGDVFPELEILNFGECNIRDLSPLSKCKGLKELWLNNNPVKDLSPLSGLNNLETLAVDYSNVINLCPLSDLKNLKCLYISHTKVFDLSPLSELGLKCLDLRGCDFFDLSPLFRVKSLKWVDLAETRFYGVSMKIIKFMRDNPNQFGLLKEKQKFLRSAVAFI